MGIEIVRITKIKEESKHIRTFFFDKRFKFIPGQFVMVWIPGIDEKPFALSYENGITVQLYGEFTRKLFEMKEGDCIGIRGPYGRGFELRNDSKRILIIAGGIGISPLIPLAENAKKKNIRVDFLVGFKSKEQIIFLDKMREFADKIIVTTEDGSYGLKGYPTDYLKEIIEESNYDQIFVCGPEIMMKKVFDIINFKIETQYSLARYIKCGIGICGSCVLDDKGYLICKDGPVFYDRELIGTSFGKYFRDESGRKIFFKF